MKRSNILERLYELDRELPDDKDLITKLMYDVIHNNISIEDAEVKLRSIDPNYVRYEFLQNLKGKPLYKNISEYKKGNLNKIQIAKMVSSLITQILIQKEQNPDVNIKSLQIDVLLDLIQEFSRTSEINDSKLNMLIDQYGWKKEESNNG